MEERLACPVCPSTSTMPGDRLPQGWEEMMQPINFDEFDFDYSWMADDRPRGQCQFQIGETYALKFTPTSKIVPSGCRHEAQGLIPLKDNKVRDGYDQHAADENQIPTQRPFHCGQCPAAYHRLGDLTRHQKEKHSTASSKYLCHIELCPRSIVGEGFGRMHHLVAHLKSNKHGMDAKEAAYVARQHNLPKSKVTGNGGLGVEEAL